MQPRILTDYAVRLLTQGYVCLPLRAGGKHLDLAAMGYEPLHLPSQRKDLKELAFCSISFQLSQKPPSADDVGRWFGDFSGNVGLLAGLANLLILDFDDIAAYLSWRRRYDA
ncbi:MAG: DNA primase, partial [Mesorhizobium sp.]